MEDHLRFAVAYWHTFTWPGGDPFGGQTFERPWFDDTMDAAKLKADVAFEFFSLLGAPFYCFHDADVRPEGNNFAENTKNLNEIVDYFEKKQAETGVKLLWGTANLFSNRRLHVGRRDQSGSGCVCILGCDGEDLPRCYQAARRRRTMFCGAVAKVMRPCSIPTCRARLDQIGRFLNLVVEYKYKIGFEGHDPDRAEAAGADQAPV